MAKVRRIAWLLVLSFGLAHQAWAVPAAGSSSPYDALRAALAAARYEPGDPKSNATDIVYPLGKSSVLIHFFGCVRGEGCKGMGLRVAMPRGPARIALQDALSENPPEVVQLDVDGPFTSMGDVVPLVASASSPATMDNVRPLVEAIPTFLREAQAAADDIARDNACRIPGAPNVTLVGKNGDGVDMAVLHVPGSPGHTSLLDITLHRKGNGYTVADVAVRIADPLADDGQLETMRVDGRDDFDMASDLARPGLSVGRLRKYGDELKAIADRILAGKTATVTILSYPSRKPLLTRTFDIASFRPELARLQATASWACATR